jgi:FAD/FMN-containing dehydrogenase
MAAPLAAGCAAPGGGNWSGLQAGMEGELLLPDDAAFENARKLYQTRFDHIRPMAVARVRTARDVKACVDFARRGGIAVHVRSGGHHYAGWSTGPGLQVDVGAMNRVSLDPATDIATIGAGTQLIDVYDRLAAQGRALPGGSCPTVGIAGLVLGGGISMLGRAYGMTCDNLLAAEIVTAAGEIITCDAQRHPDLFWACRGGGGGNFGIATSFRFRTHPLRRITTMRLDWDWPSAAGVMRSWQAWAPKAPDALWANCRFGGNANGNQVSVTIVFLGNQAELAPLLPGLIAPVGAEPRRTVENQDGLHAMLALAGCAKVTVPECHLGLTSAQGTLGRGTYKAKSQFFDRPLSDDGIAIILRHIERAGTVPGLSGGSILLDAFGGAVARVSPGATAFVHRNALFSCQYLANWRADTDAEAQAGSWMRNFHAEMQPHASGGAFINYVDPELEGWQRAYYGANYERLVRVKAAYDPDGLFRMPQGVGSA